jgi:hypothetical protein
MDMKKALFLTAALAMALSGAAQYQLPNGGFEEWDGGETSEPAHWNSFASSDGSFASLASSPHHYRRNGGRPGTTVSHFLTLYTQSILGIKANGNMTTGRIHAGSMSAASSENYNYTQRSNADHSLAFTGTPDSMYVWVSYYAADAGSQAQVSAILHGDNDFRAPNQEGDASLYCAKAVARFGRTTSSAHSYQWQQMKVPFVYDGNAAPHYMLVNLTTNATPGGGDSNDSLSIDDIEFVYSAWLTGVSIDGRAVRYFRKGKLDYTVHVDDAALLNPAEVVGTPEVADATVATEVEPVDDTTTLVSLTVTAEDGVTAHTYRLTLTTGNPEGAFPLAIGDGPEAPAFKLYPNPATDAVNIDADGTVALSDLAGRRLQTLEVHGTARIDLSALPAGTYLLSCGNAVRRLVKE